MELLEPESGSLTNEEKDLLVDLLKTNGIVSPSLYQTEVEYYSASLRHVFGIYKRRLTNISREGRTKIELETVVKNLSKFSEENIKVIFLPSGIGNKPDLVFCDINISYFFGIIHSKKNLSN
ncbi:hypothetical protein [Spirosoma pollinicola]|uniref:Uncharacterized protein n=1 Tax=Spirosoma pollinicola TaxID=2057025 RepID=A0A2K8YYR4_9BACT|nr:hypothetical protein [Spirosoma pollinicola]AUD02688.1 hypothetical protein CWM47_13080 [Spirosoma pollinicola]